MAGDTNIPDSSKKDGVEISPRKVDSDPVETREWLEAINSVIEQEGVERAQYILQRLSSKSDGDRRPIALRN